MTSSLVGSEMCIRDSYHACCWSVGQPYASCDRPRPENRTPSETLVCQQPVSYTHLTLPTICSV
eukprot:8161748-Prorocentrum_lima.AAC.1